MSTEKSYGQIARETFLPNLKHIPGAWEACDSKKDWEQIAVNIIAEYERRNGYLEPEAEASLQLTIKELRKQVAHLTKQLEYRAEKLTSVEKIAKAYFKGIGGDWHYLEEKHRQVHLIGAQAVLDLLQEKQLACDETGKQGCVKEVCTEERAEEKQPETESQYQDRLLRALRDFG